MNDVRSNFASHDGAGYEQQMGRWSRRLAPVFLDFAGAADGERVLDVGCGTGSLSFALARRSRPARLVGVDISGPYIAHALALSQDPALSFQVGDAGALDFPDNSFERVLSLLVLHFIPGVRHAVREMCRVARPGATVAAAVWDNRGGFVAGRMFWDTAAALVPSAVEQRARHFTRPMTRPGELHDAFRAAGLRQVEQTTLSIRMEFVSWDDFWAPYEGNEGPVASYIRSLHADQRARIRDAVKAAYLDGEPDGMRSYAAGAWAVKGIAPG